MVQSVLSRRRGDAGRVGWVLCVVLALLAPAGARKPEKAAGPQSPDLLLEGGRKLVYERSFGSESDLRGKPGFWAKLVNFVAGQPDYRVLIRPYSIAIDSRGRAIVTDPGASGIHIFDLEKNKYKFIERLEAYKDPMLSPQCVAVDAHDNIYVSDSESGKIFVFNSDGKFQHALGSLKGGEGFFKRPTGIAVDSAAQRIYITDTLRDKIFVLDMQGQVMQTIGKPGTDNGEFHFPTELRLDDRTLLVVDAMNFRVQLLARDGSFQATMGQIGNSVGRMFRPKATGIDSEGHIYVVDGSWGIVQAFDREGRLLYYFGRGSGLGDFRLPTGLFVDHNDRIYVVDSYERRVEVFRYHGLSKQAEGATH